MTSSRNTWPQGGTGHQNFCWGVHYYFYYCSLLFSKTFNHINSLEMVNPIRQKKFSSQLICFSFVFNLKRFLREARGHLVDRLHHRRDGGRRGLVSGQQRDRSAVPHPEDLRSTASFNGQTSAEEPEVCWMECKRYLCI